MVCVQYSAIHCTAVVVPVDPSNGATIESILETSYEMKNKSAEMRCSIWASHQYLVIHLLQNLSDHTCNSGIARLLTMHRHLAC